MLKHQFKETHLAAVGRVIWGKEDSQSEKTIRLHLLYVSREEGLF